MSKCINPFWIPCKEKLPKQNIRVLAVLDEGDDVDTEIIIAVYCCDYDTEEMMWLDNNGVWYSEECVTHWVPLPELPEM